MSELLFLVERDTSSCFCCQTWPWAPSLSRRIGRECPAACVT